MAEPTIGQMTVERPLSYRLDELLGDVRPLRACFEELALQVRTALFGQGIVEPLLEAALALRYAGEPEPLTIPFLLEIESAAVCSSDPLPLDGQALRQAVAAFRLAHQERTGAVDFDTPVEVVMLRVRGSGDLVQLK